jgi:hypothetical protein
MGRQFPSFERTCSDPGACALLARGMVRGSYFSAFQFMRRRFVPSKKVAPEKPVWAQARNSNVAGDQWTNPKISFSERDCSASEIA